MTSATSLMAKSMISGFVIRLHCSISLLLSARGERSSEQPASNRLPQTTTALSTVPMNRENSHCPAMLNLCTLRTIFELNNILCRSANRLTPNVPKTSYPRHIRPHPFPGPASASHTCPSSSGTRLAAAASARPSGPGQGRPRRLASDGSPTARPISPRHSTIAPQT